MAEDFQVSRTTIDSLPAKHRPATTADDPDAARAQIEATRARMSETIDEIEDVLLRKKEEIREKLDVLAPVRERPLQTIGMLFGIGLALGLVTGGGNGNDDDDEEIEDEEMEDEEDEAAEAWERAETWEDRAHRLLRIARAQESELEIHRARAAKPRRHIAVEDDDEEDFDEDEAGDGLFDRIRDVAAERLSGAVSEVMQRMMRG